VEKWDRRSQHVEEIVAAMSVLLVARAAFEVAVEQYPNVQLTLRRGTRVIETKRDRDRESFAT